MVALILDVLFVTAAALVGMTAGWWLRSWGAVDAGPAPPRKEEGQADAEAPRHKMRQVEGIVARLHQLTAAVAADVGQHSHRVHEINEELSSTVAGDKGVIAVVEKLIHVNEQMEEQLHEAEGRLKDQAKEIESHVREARTDALTSLFNRRGFDDELSIAIEEARAEARPLSMMMIDVDHFKKFNDTYGHQAGDEVLKAVARVLRKQLADKEIICRYGGEEFAIVFPGSDAEIALRGAERARAAIGAEIVSFEGRDLRVTASAGLAQLEPDEQATSLIKRADEALYASKEAGRDCCHWHHNGEFRPITPGRSSSAQAEDDHDAVPDQILGMTGVSGPETFREDVDRRLGEWRRGGATVSIALLDVDDFDELTSQHGDKIIRPVLRATAQFLKATVRDMDHIAHFDKARFALMLPTAAIEDAQRVAERLRKAVERCSLPLDEGSLKFTVSIGVAMVWATSDTCSELVSRAETALLAAQQAGGNVIVKSEKTSSSAEAPPEHEVAGRQ